MPACQPCIPNPTILYHDFPHGYPSPLASLSASSLPTCSDQMQVSPLSPHSPSSNINLTLVLHGIMARCNPSSILPIRSNIYKTTHNPPNPRTTSPHPPTPNHPLSALHKRMHTKRSIVVKRPSTRTLRNSHRSRCPFLPFLLVRLSRSRSRKRVRGLYPTFKRAFTG